MIKADQKFLVLDYETFSEAELSDCGAWEYACDPSTEVLCVAYAFGTRDELRKAKPRLYVPPSSLPARLAGVRDDVAHDHEFGALLTRRDVIRVAHNAFFEQCITKHVVPRIRNLLRSRDAAHLEPDDWLCTAAMSRAVGIPGNLDGAAKAMSLTNQKDLDGHKLMLKLSKPRKPTKSDPSTRHQDPKEYERLGLYCIRDLLAEIELFCTLPMLTDKERVFWKLNQEINLRGFAVDRELVDGALHCIKRETTLLDARFRKRTGLNSARQRDATLEVLRGLGLVLPNLQAATIDAALEDPETPEDAREILEIRQSISKSSTSKYAAFELRSRTDGRARDNLIFNGAHTGRDAGTGLQPQNLFKSTLEHADLLAGLELMRRKDVTAIRALFDRPMELYASACRSCIVAPAGSTLDVGDFATIEVRVLFWLAKHERGLTALATGEDLYLQMATDIYGSDLKKLTKDYKAGELYAKDQRQLGKTTVLGAGFGMGLNGEKFQASAKAMAGLDISISLAQKAIRAYRDRHYPVVKFWDTIETCAIRALENPGKAYRHGRLTWRKESHWLTVELPIGRKLYYFAPRMEVKKTLYGESLALTYRGVDPKTKQFLRMSTWGGKLTENVVQAVARDLLYEAIARLDAAGHVPVLPVHDEIVTERLPLDAVDVYFDGGSTMFGLMAKAPAWSDGLPIKVEGWSEDRYRK